MSDHREVRFGLRRGNQRSGTYIVAGAPKTDDVYITSRHVGTQYKVSLHQSGSWRMSIEPDRCVAKVVQGRRDPKWGPFWVIGALFNYRVTALQE